MTTDAYVDGRGWMIGDIVEFGTSFGRTQRGEIVRITNLDPTGRSYKKRYWTKAILVSWGTGDKYLSPSRLTVIERPRTFRKYFLAIHANSDEDSAGVDQMGDALGDQVEQSAFLDRSLEYSFRDAVRTLSMANDYATARTLFEQTVTNATRNVPAPISTDGHEESLALVAVYKSLAAAMLGDGLDRSAINYAAGLLKQLCDSTPGGYWDFLGKCRYLLAVMLLMLADDSDGARDMLKSKRSFQDFEDLRWILKKLLRKSVTPSSDEELARQALGCFDLMRHPFAGSYRDVFHRDLIVLLLGALLEKLLHAPGDELNWQRVAQAIYA